MKFKLIFFIINCILFCSDKPYVIIVSLDGYRYDYSEKVFTPNLDYIKNNGVKSKSLKPVFPSLTFPNHYSIATGCYADEHRITGNQFYSKEHNEYYSYKNSKTVQDGKFYGCEPIWVTAGKNEINSATFFWIGSEAEILGYRPTIYKKYNPQISFNSRIDSAMYWLDLPDEISPQLIMLYFSEPDHKGHKNGPNSIKTLNEVSRMDSLIGYLLNEIDKRKNNKNINLIVLSDHGMSQIDKNNIILLDNYISNLDHYQIYGSGSFIQLDKKNKFTEYNFNEINKIPAIKYYDKPNIPNKLHFKNINSGELLIIADEGYLLGTKENINSGIFKLKGMHGYNPELLNMHGIFYAIGPDIKKNVEIDSFENIQIYPLICKLLNIDEYKKSQFFDYLVINKILK